MSTALHYLVLPDGGGSPDMLSLGQLLGTDKTRVGGLIGRILHKYGDRLDAIDKYREEMNAERFVERNDAANASQGLHFARDLEHMYSEILTEPRPLTNALRLFPIDTSVPRGAKFHTIQRTYGDGEVKVYRGKGQKIPRVGMSAKEETFNVRHYVTSWLCDIFEIAAAGFANLDKQSELLRIARDIMDDFLNWQTWYGDDENGLPGVLNYPWIRKKVIATPFVEGSDSNDIIRELHRLADFPYLSQRQAFKPTVMVLSPRVHSFLKQTRIGPDTAKTILTQFLENNAHIERVEEAHELQNDDDEPIPGVPPGLDVILAYRPDRLGITNVVPQPFTTLPTQELGFELTTYAYMSHGGVIMREVGNNIIGYVTPPPLF